MPTENLDLQTALAVATTLRSISSSIRDNLVRKLKSQLGAPGGAGRSLDKSGAAIQAEALQVALLMHGLRGVTEGALLESLRAHDADAQVAAFLHYWASLSLVAGFVAPGAGDHVQPAYVDWYRGPPGQARYMPALATLRSDLEAFVLQGWAPPAPPIRRDRMVTALGSCFADEIRLWLRGKGYRVNEDFRAGASYPHVEDSAVPLLQCSAGLVNTFVLLQQFQWAFEGRAFDDDLWVGSKGQITVPTEAARQKTAEMFAQTSLFVVTLGLAEVWFQRRATATATATHMYTSNPQPTSTDHEAEAAASGETTSPTSTNGAAVVEQAEAKAAEAGLPPPHVPMQAIEQAIEQAMWRAVPSDRYDPSRHSFRVTSVAENLANLQEIVRLVRRHVPGASLVFTLSPVPLAATFRGVSCVTANACSKAILRVAVDELLRGEQQQPQQQQQPQPQPQPQGEAVHGVRCGDSGGLYYWPAYEMVKEGFSEPYLDDGRHPKPEVVSQILQLFGKHYLPREQGAAAADSPQDTQVELCEKTAAAELT